MNIPNILINELLPHIEGLAPHSYFATQKALSFIEGLNKMQHIANIACETGLQTIRMLSVIKTRITVVDSINAYINNFQKELKIQKLEEFISPVCHDLDNLPFKEEELDLIWAESIANKLSFETALENWHIYLKEDGYIGICAYCSNTQNLPEEAENYFRKNNIDIDSISNRIHQMAQLGFVPTAHFVMPDECWWNYFCPIDIHKDELLQKYPDNSEVEEFVKKVDQEIELFENYGYSYEYVFFIGKKQ